MWINENTGNYFKDSHFSIGYTIGYQGLFMAQKRFSITYGLYYSYVTAYVDTYNSGPTDIDITIPPNITIIYSYKYEAKWNNIEMPIGVRYNILKGSKFQPYVSFNIIMIYPLTYDVKLVNVPSQAANNLWTKANYEISLDGNVELAIGLNYRTDNYIFNLHPFLRPETINGFPRKFGLGFAVLRKF